MVGTVCLRRIRNNGTWIPPCCRDLSSEVRTPPRRPVCIPGTQPRNTFTQNRHQTRGGDKRQRKGDRWEKERQEEKGETRGRRLDRSESSDNWKEGRYEIERETIEKEKG
jgi:hypothetical protein